MVVPKRKIKNIHMDSRVEVRACAKADQYLSLAEIDTRSVMLNSKLLWVRLCLSFASLCNASSCFSSKAQSHEDFPQASWMTKQYIKIARLRLAAIANCLFQWNSMHYILCVVYYALY